MSQLELRQANEAERAAIFAKVHEFWGGTLTVEAYVERCLKAAAPRRATWYLGRVGDEIVTSLGAHPTIFSVDGELASGFSIASVHTRPRDRGRGYAPRLIEYVERVERERGARLSVLYSDIDPAYYARLGYRRAPAFGGDTATDTAARGAVQAPAGSLETFDPGAELDEMARFYEVAHGQRRFHIHRAPEYARMLLAKRPKDEYFWLQDLAGGRLGYARFEPADERVKITDFVLLPEQESRRETFYRLLIAAAGEQGYWRVGGWLPDLPAARNCFEFGPRKKEITMAKVLDESLVLPDEALATAEYFNEIDHV
ncbi:MAG: GNAT family N-acetyltransferase [Pirellulales bacterium]|nr:GNAT family N-acetyltransferase [Pirellulales bacterium]